MMLGGRGSTPVLINLLMMCLKMERSGGSLCKSLGWKCRAKGEIWAGRGLGLNLACGRHCANLLCSSGRDMHGRGFGVPSAPSTMVAPLTPTCLRTGQASLWWELAAPRVSGEVAMLTAVLDVVVFVAEGTAAWAVTSAMAFMLGEHKREETTAASCGAAGAGDKAEVELLFNVLSKCFLASEGTRANGNFQPTLFPAYAAEGKCGPSDHGRIAMWTMMPWLLKCRMEALLLSLLNFTSFWSETTEAWSFFVPWMVDVPKGVCKRLPTLTCLL